MMNSDALREASSKHVLLRLRLEGRSRHVHLTALVLAMVQLLAGCNPHASRETCEMLYAEWRAECEEKITRTSGGREVPAQFNLHPGIYKRFVEPLESVKRMLKAPGSEMDKLLVRKFDLSQPVEIGDHFLVFVYAARNQIDVDEILTKNRAQGNHYALNSLLVEDAKMHNRYWK